MGEGRVDSNIGTATLTMGVDICTGVLMISESAYLFQDVT